MRQNNQPRPTPETDAAFRDGYTFCAEDMRPAVEFCANLERERDGARTQADNFAKQLEAMREAIKEAHYTLAYVYNHGEGSCTFPYRTDDDLCSENRFHHVKDALDALQPFLKP